MRDYVVLYKGQVVEHLKAKTIQKATNSYEMEQLVQTYGPNLHIKLVPKTKKKNPSSGLYWITYETPAGYQKVVRARSKGEANEIAKEFRFVGRKRVQVRKGNPTSRKKKVNRYIVEIKRKDGSYLDAVYGATSASEARAEARADSYLGAKLRSREYKITRVVKKDQGLLNPSIKKGAWTPCKAVKIANGKLLIRK